MGQFSWISCDTKKRIYNDGTTAQTVHMVAKMPDGSFLRFIEKDYAGYGEFRGMDFYELFANMNSLPVVNPERRIDGIEACFKSSPEDAAKFVYPQLFLGNPPPVSLINFGFRTEDDPNQGWYNHGDEYDE